MQNRCRVLMGVLSWETQEAEQSPQLDQPDQNPSTVGDQTRQDLFKSNFIGLCAQTRLLPGQGFWQTLVRALAPSQSRPPYLGGGASHALIDTCSPSPQVVEQGLNGDHAPQLPSTADSQTEHNRFLPKTLCPLKSWTGSCLTRTVGQLAAGLHLVAVSGATITRRRGVIRREGGGAGTGPPLGGNITTLVIDTGTRTLRPTGPTGPTAVD